MFIGQFKAMQKEPGEEKKEPETTQSTESVRSTSSEEFLKSPETKAFISDWTEKLRSAKATPSNSEKRTVVDLLGTLHRISNLSDKEVLKSAESILMKMCDRGGFGTKMKAATEGVFKAIKSALGGG